MKNFLGLYVLLSCAQVIFSEAIRSKACTNPGENNAISTVTQVRIAPCPYPGDGLNEPCKLKRGTSAKISVDFIPQQRISQMRASLVYVRKNSAELKFRSLESNGCKSLGEASCPLSPFMRYTWSADVRLYKAYPAGVYPLKLKLTEEAPERAPSTVLCQTFLIELI